MKRRVARSRHIASTFVAAILVLFLVVAGGWYLGPWIDGWSPGGGPAIRDVVTIDDVNLRTGPGTSFKVLAVIPAGTGVSAERESVDGFVAVRVNGKHGWIASDYLSEPGVAYAAEHTVVEAPSDDKASVPVPTPEPPAVAPEPTAVSTAAPVIAGSTQVEREPQPGEKWIEVDRTNRTVTLHNGEIVVATFDALIGKDLSPDGYYSTAVGTYYVHVKEKALAETPFADGVYLSDFVGFDPVRSNGFHSPTRDASGNVVVTGGTATLGCVRLSEADAAFLFDFAYIGMRVEVHD